MPPLKLAKILKALLLTQAWEVLEALRVILKVD